MEGCASALPACHDLFLTGIQGKPSAGPERSRRSRRPKWPRRAKRPREGPGKPGGLGKAQEGPGKPAQGSPKKDQEDQGRPKKAQEVQAQYPCTSLRPLQAVAVSAMPRSVPHQGCRALKGLIRPLGGPQSLITPLSPCPHSVITPLSLITPLSPQSLITPLTLRGMKKPLFLSTTRPSKGLYKASFVCAKLNFPIGSELIFRCLEGLPGGTLVQPSYNASQSLNTAL